MQKKRAPKKGTPFVVLMIYRQYVGSNIYAETFTVLFPVPDLALRDRFFNLTFRR